MHWHGIQSRAWNLLFTSILMVDNPLMNNLVIFQLSIYLNLVLKKKKFALTFYTVDVSSINLIT